MYTGTALAQQSIEPRKPLERFWVRDFDVADREWPEGYEIRDVDEGPMTREAADSLARLLNERPHENGVQFRVCEGRSQYRRNDDDS